MPFIGKAAIVLLIDIANGRLVVRYSSIGKPVSGLTEVEIGGDPPTIEFEDAIGIVKPSSAANIKTNENILHRRTFIMVTIPENSFKYET